MAATTSQLRVQSFDVPDEVFPVAAVARLDIIRLGEVTANRVTFQPGFRLTDHIRAITGTDLCPMRHTGYVVSGRAGLRLADGTERELGAGDAFDIPPGHDMWTIGAEPWVAVDFDQPQTQ
jgi:quercetin dioxygenase-like cupin family protein